MEPQALDLSALSDPLERSTRWTRAIPQIFDGLSVIAPRGGLRSARIASFGFGPGWIAGIEGSTQRVLRKPSRSDRTSSFFKVLLQVAGSCQLRHAGRSIALTPGCLTLVDGAGAFDMQLGGEFKQLLFQLPRDLVLRRHPKLGSLTASLFERGVGSTDLVFNAYAELARAVEALGAEQRAHAFEACVAYLGMLTSGALGAVADPFDRACADIEAELSDANLDARAIAARAGLSRRRLDAIFRARGTTVTGFIWERRLQRVADELADPLLGHRKLIDVAFSFGFSDAAHFSRAFRKRFGVSPRSWRDAARSHSYTTVPSPARLAAVRAMCTSTEKASESTATIDLATDGRSCRSRSSSSRSPTACAPSWLTSRASRSNSR